MRHSPTLLLLLLATSAAQGQTPPGRAEVKQVLREALTLHASMPKALPRLPERMDEPVRAVAPGTKRAPAPSTRLSGEVLERAGRMATELPAAVPAEPTRMGAAAAGAAADTQAAAGRAQAEEVRQQLPPPPGTPGGPVVAPPSPPPAGSPLDSAPTAPSTPPSGTPDPPSP